MKTSFRLRATVVGVAFAAGLASPAIAQNFTMKFGTATVNEPQHEYIKFFKEEVEQRSGGRIKVEVYPQSQLGPIPRQIEGLQLGTVEGFIGPADFYVGVDNILNTLPPLGLTGVGNGSGIYSNRGRFAYAGISARF